MYCSLSNTLEELLAKLYYIILKFENSLIKYKSGNLKICNISCIDNSIILELHLFYSDDNHKHKPYANLVVYDVEQSAIETNNKSDEIIKFFSHENVKRFFNIFMRNYDDFADSILF